MGKFHGRLDECERWKPAIPAASARPAPVHAGRADPPATITEEILAHDEVSVGIGASLLEHQAVRDAVDVGQRRARPALRR